jgi:hypothetical protein
MKFRHLLTASVAYAACLISVPASAAPLLFNFSGPSGTALFQLNSNPTPDFASTFIGSDQFGFNDVAGTFGGTPGTSSTISFGNGIFASLSITAPNLGFTQFSSPTLFTGSPNAPVFSTGSFTLVNPFFGNGTLNISSATAAVPEPASLAMMFVAFGAIGLARRRRSRVSTGIQFA